MTKSSQKNAIIVFAKFPREGKVKTRLAKTTGNKCAAEFYKLCAEHTFNELEKLSSETFRVYLFFAEEENKGEIESWINSDFFYFEQSGKDLGEKMLNAFEKVFEDGFQNVLIIGTDLPDISVDIIKTAFSELGNTDSVIGPSTDGGYYLLGIKRPVKSLFHGINWSTDSVFTKTVEKLNAQNLEVKTLPELVDIDTETDLKKWLNTDDNRGNNRLRTMIKSIYHS